MPALPSDWHTALAGHGFGQVKVQQLIDDAYQPTQGSVYPPRAQVLRAFELTRLNRVRAVILGQDPYFKHAGQAHGLSFSVPQLAPSVPASVRIPPAVYSIFSNLEQMAPNDPLRRFMRPPNGDLSGWARDGVLLLNVALTVRAGEPESHLSIWQDFTAAVLAALRDGGQPIAFMLWGDWAQSYRGNVAHPAQTFLMPHPAYRPKKGQKNVWRAGHRLPFAEANAYLVGNNRAEIDWRLP